MTFVHEKVPFFATKSASSKCLHRLAADIQQDKSNYEGIFVYDFLFKDILVPSDFYSRAIT